MKKTMTLIVAAAMGMSVLAGCQGSSNTASSSSSSSSASESTSESSTSSASTSSSSSEEEQLDYIEGDFTFDECLELPKYKGLKLEKDVTEVTDGMIRAQYTTLMSDELEEVTDANAKIQYGDKVTMDYECKFGDGEYGDPQGTDYSVIIGSKTTIDGFEDGLIGHKNGEEVYLDLTFPENYTEEYAGKDVTFHITITKIERAADPTDEWVNTYTEGEYTTVKDYDKHLKEDFESSYEASAKSTLRQSAWSEVYDNVKFKALPKEYVDEGKATMEEQVQTMMETYGIESMDDFLEQSGMTQEDYDETIKTQSESYAKSKLVINAIWEKEKLSEDDELFKAVLQDLIDSNATTEEDLYSDYGEDTVKDYCKQYAVIDFIIENADVKEV